MRAADSVSTDIDNDNCRNDSYDMAIIYTVLSMKHIKLHCGYSLTHSQEINIINTSYLP